MGLTASSLEQNSGDATLVRVPRYTLEEKRKKLSKFNTLKKKLSRSKSGFRNHDHGKMLRDLTQTWTSDEIDALVEEYETCLNVKEMKSQTNLVRDSAPGLKRDFLKLFKEGVCADTTLVLEGFYVHVHKAILSSRCSYFKDLLSQHCEANPVINMESKTKGMTKEMFSTLLCYLYTGDFVLKKSGLEYLDVLINLGEEFGTPNVLEQDLKALLNNGDYADVLLSFPGQCTSDTCSTSSGNMLPEYPYEILCHKAILCARSPYFRSLLNKKDLNLVDAESGKSNCIRLVLDESIITRRYARVVLQCMYTDCVDLSSVVKWSSEERRDCGPGTHKLLTTAEIAMEVFEVASFIDLPVLMQGCEDIILEELSPSTLVPTLEWSSLPHGSSWVYRQAVQFLQEEFVNIAQSESFYSLPKYYLVEALKSDFLQACEHDVLLSVVKWGEAQVARKMSEQDPVQDSKKSSKRREIDNKQLKKVLSGVIDHVRVGHVIPPHSELLESVFRRGLVDRGMPLDIGEGSFYPNLPWMRRREERDFVRPRLFLPYFEEAKVILQEHRLSDKELSRQRMSRVTHNMPDTLYMIEPQKRARNHSEPVFSFPSAAFGRLDLGTGHSTPQTSVLDDSDSEFERYMRTGRTNSMSSGESEPIGTDKVMEREFGLPDVAMEVPSYVPDEYWEREARSPSRHPFGVEVTEHVLHPVPDVALPSSPTPSVSSGVPPEYLRMDQSLEFLDDDSLNGNS